MAGGFENPSIQATATATATDQQQLAKVKVSTIPVLASMLQQDERPDFEVLVRVQAPTHAALRAPMDLVAVLDVSGSMSWSPDANKTPKDGEPSRLVLLKDAMKFIVHHLHAGDRLAAVTFNHNVVQEFKMTEISDDGKERKSMNDWVDKLMANGFTLFAPGLDRALEILENRSRADKEKRVAFIVFLSDGEEYLPNDKRDLELSDKYPSKNDWKTSSCGSKEYVDLRGRLKAHTVHTFGFSKFHDPTSLCAIADVSGGTFSFLREGLDKITDAFALCLGGLQTVVAADVTINLAVEDHNVLITGIDSGGYGKSVAKDGKSGKIVIPVLYAGEAKDFIVHLNVPCHGTDRQTLLTTHGHWRLLEADVVDIEKDGMVLARPVVAHAGGDEQGPKQQVQDDGRVVEQVLRFKVLEMLEEFLKSADLKGDKAAVAESESSLGRKWASLKADGKSRWSALADGVVSRYEEYVTEMRANLKNGDGGAYVSSWRSSNLMQRVTTMGSPEKVVPEFKTEAIEKMGEEAKKPLLEVIDEPQAAVAAPAPEEEPAAVAAEPAPLLLGPEERPWPCACPEYDMIGKQLAYWCVVKRDLLRLVKEVEGDGGHHNLTVTFHDFSLASINRAMYESVFLAVEHSHNIRRCYCAAIGHHAIAAVDDGEEH